MGKIKRADLDLIRCFAIIFVFMDCLTSAFTNFQIHR